MSLYIELQDDQWPFEYTSHDREIVRALVYDEQGYFYFVRADRDDDFGKAEYIETSGGGVETGEDYVTAIKRELKEELGVEVEVIEKIGVVSDYYNLIHRHNINNYFLCRIISFGDKNMTEAEINDYHLSTVRLKLDDAIKEYERYSDTGIGRLIANRELPVLEYVKDNLGSICNISDHRKRYIALLRGINISGKNRISMSELKDIFTDNGFGSVRTYLNSGNVIFECEETDEKMLAERISVLIKEKFSLDIPVAVILQSYLKSLLDTTPQWWGTDDKTFYDNLIFMIGDNKAEEIAERIGPATEGIEQIEIKDNVIFWTFILGKHPKANWYKRTAEAGIGETMTIRTAGTCRKLSEME